MTSLDIVFYISKVIQYIWIAIGLLTSVYYLFLSIILFGVLNILVFRLGSSKLNRIYDTTFSIIKISIFIILLSKLF